MPDPSFDNQQLGLEGQKARALEHLSDLVSAGSLPFDAFTRLTDVVVSANTHSELDGVLHGLPTVVEFTRPDRRLDHPLVINLTHGALRLQENWQLARHTEVNISSGSCRMDLGGATWDDRVIDLKLRISSGTLAVQVPRGVEVQMVSIGGNVRNSTSRAGLLPGAPLLRVDASAASGVIRLAHPALPKAPGRWRRWRQARRARAGRGRAGRGS